MAIKLRHLSKLVVLVVSAVVLIALLITVRQLTELTENDLLAQENQKTQQAYVFKPIFNGNTTKFHVIKSTHKLKQFQQLSGEEIVITTKNGLIRGIKTQITKLDGKSTEIFAFLGVPYAAPPTGSLRFKRYGISAISQTKIDL